MKTIEDKFLKLLKNTAREQSLLGQEKLIPDQFSDLANFVGNHTWQSILVLSFFSTVLLNLLVFIGNEL